MSNRHGFFSLRYEFRHGWKIEGRLEMERRDMRIDIEIDDEHNPVARTRRGAAPNPALSTVPDIELFATTEVASPRVPDIELFATTEVASPRVPDIELFATTEVASPRVPDIELFATTEVASPRVPDIELFATTEVASPRAPDIGFDVTDEIGTTGISASEFASSTVRSGRVAPDPGHAAAKELAAAAARVVLPAAAGVTASASDFVPACAISLQSLAGRYAVLAEVVIAVLAALPGRDSVLRLGLRNAQRLLEVPPDDAGPQWQEGAASEIESFRELAALLESKRRV